MRLCHPAGRPTRLTRRRDQLLSGSHGALQGAQNNYLRRSTKDLYGENPEVCPSRNRQDLKVRRLDGLNRIAHPKRAAGEDFAAQPAAMGQGLHQLRNLKKILKVGARFTQFNTP